MSEKFEKLRLMLNQRLRALHDEPSECEDTELREIPMIEDHIGEVKEERGGEKKVKIKWLSCVLCI
jgi:hypothetical protein